MGFWESKPKQVALRRDPEIEQAARMVAELNAHIRQLEQEIISVHAQGGQITTTQYAPEPQPAPTGWQPIPSHDGYRPLPMKRRSWLGLGWYKSRSTRTEPLIAGERCPMSECGSW